LRYQIVTRVKHLTCI